MTALTWHSRTIKTGGMENNRSRTARNYGMGRVWPQSIFVSIGMGLMEPLCLLVVTVLTQTMYVSKPHCTICQKEQILLKVNFKAHLFLRCIFILHSALFRGAGLSLNLHSPAQFASPHFTFSFLHIQQHQGGFPSPTLQGRRVGRLPASDGPHAHP